jgi:hypothetical protein
MAGMNKPISQDLPSKSGGGLPELQIGLDGYAGEE